jgi:hypothetical protein
MLWLDGTPPARDDARGGPTDAYLPLPPVTCRGEGFLAVATAVDD